MIPKKDIEIAAHLRQNARVKLTVLSRMTGLPVSTLFDHVRMLEGLCITRLAALLDFRKLGFGTCATIFVKAAKDRRNELRKHLLCSMNVNSLMRVNNGYDFMAECVFRDMQGLEDFCEHLEHEHGVKSKEVHFVIEELKREGFLSDPSAVKKVMQNA